MAIVRLEPDAAVPGWASRPDAGLQSVVRTRAELSIVCPEAHVPPGAPAERGWRALEVSGPLDLAATGVLAALIVPLAEAAVPVFAVSTYDTDYVLVPGGRLPDAAAALRTAGHGVEGDG
jgi:hypothetical protein